VRVETAVGFDRTWACLLATWLCSMIMLGGTGFPAPAIQTYFNLSSLVLIVIGVWRLRNGMPSRAATFAAVLAGLSLALVLAQLIPIPFELWKTLPGRDVVLKSFDAIGETPSALPLSLSPDATKRAAVSLLPPLAAFIGILSVPRRMFWFISAAIFACAMIGFVLGIIQASQGAASGLFFHVDDSKAGKFAAGTFANRNFFATQIFVSVPFLAAFAMSLAERWNLRPALTYLFTFVYMGLMVAVLAAVGSRAGIILSMVSVLASILLVLRLSPARQSQIGVGKGLIAALVLMVVMAQASMVGLLRLAQTDPVSDFRGTIAAVSFKAAQDQFPAGSGFGTFVPVYQLYETPETIVNPYINHAHNEWLEVAIEGGAPALILIVVFVLWLLYMLVQALRLAPHNASHAHIRAAGLATVLMLLHAVVDFPFRTDAILTLFGLCIGFLALATAQPALQSPRRSSSKPKEQSVGAGQRPQSKAFTPAKRPFTSRQEPKLQPDPAQASTPDGNNS
jgi:O-antigen ligase